MLTIKRKQYLILLSFVVLSYIYMLPYYHTGNLINYLPPDLIFHLNRMKGLADIWQSPISYTAFGHMGNGVNYFYPWLTYYPAYLLSVILHSIVKGYIIYIYLLTILHFYVAYKCMLAFSGKSKQAYIFSLLYTFSTYRAVDILARNAVGEFIALAFLPFVFYNLYRTLYLDSKKWYLLSAGVSILIYTHILSALMTSALMLLIVIISWKKLDNKKTIIVSLILAIILCLMLTMAYWLPMLQQQFSVGIYRPAILDLEGSALKPSNIFNAALNNQLEQFSFGIVYLFIFLIGCFNFKKLDNMYKTVICLTGVTLFLASDLFPWHLFQQTPVNLIQFPWRLLGYATFFISIYGSLILSSYQIRTLGKYIIPIVMLLLVCLHFSSSLSLMHSWHGTVINTENEVESIKQFTIADYYPKKSIVNQKSIKQGKFIISNHPKSIHFKVVNNLVKFHIHNNSNNQYIDTPVLFYTGSKITVNNKSVNFKQSNRGTLQFYIPKGNSSITISNQYTLLGKIAFFVSSLSVLIVMFYIVKMASKVRN